MKTCPLLLCLSLAAGCATAPKADRDLFAAVKEDNPAEVQRSVAAGANVNARSDVGWTPLHQAMERLAGAPANRTPPAEDVAKVVRVVELLLAGGAAVDAQASVGTPLHLAALTGQKLLVQMLIDKGAAVNARSSDGQTPLYQAAKKDSAEVAELLVARGAEVNARTRSGYTALMVSAGNGNPDVAKVLLAHGADVNVTDKDGFTALLSASRSLLIRYTLQASTPGAEDVRRKSRGHLASELETLRSVKGEFSAVAVMLVNRGADPNAAAPGFTPLAAAATTGDRAVAEALLDHGARIDDASMGETPLHASIAERHGDIAELLIRRGANVKAPNMSQLTPLHFLAVHMHDQKLAELLIQKGGDVNARDKAGHTPLEGAVRAKNNEVAEVLRRHGAQ